MTMPNLNTEEAAFAAFFNVIEQGGLPPEDVTWGDVTDNSNVQWVDSYSNGVILGYSNGPFGNTRVRCKTDGWCVAYNNWDGSVNESTGSGNRLKGIHELTPMYTGSWGDWYANIDGPPEQNRFAQAVSDIAHSLSSSGAMSFSYSDVGFYDFLDGSDSLSVFFNSQDDAQTGTETRTVNVLSGTTVERNHTGFTGQKKLSDYTMYGKVDGITAFNGDTQDYGLYDTTNLLSDDGQLNVTIESADGAGVGAAVATTWSEAN